MPLEAESYRRHVAHHTLLANVNSGTKFPGPNQELTKLVEDKIGQELALQYFPTNLRILRWEEFNRSNRYDNRIGFLHESALAEAYRLIQEACWKLYSTQPESTEGQKDGGWQNMLPLHALQRSLRQGESCLLLIDGHNVLFRLMSILQLDFEGNSPGSRARKQLVDKVSALAARFQCIDIHLWYDGEDAHDISVSRNLVVHYSGGLGGNRADAEIVNYLHSIDYMRVEQQSRLKVLVSADKGLSDAARLQGAAIVLAPEELAILLSLPNR